MEPWVQWGKMQLQITRENLPRVQRIVKPWYLQLNYKSSHHAGSRSVVTSYDEISWEMSAKRIFVRYFRTKPREAKRKFAPNKSLGLQNFVSGKVPLVFGEKSMPEKGHFQRIILHSTGHNQQRNWMSWWINESNVESPACELWM